jgi:hypothetical protein
MHMVFTPSNKAVSITLVMLALGFAGLAGTGWPAIAAETPTIGFTVAGMMLGERLDLPECNKNWSQFEKVYTSSAKGTCWATPLKEYKDFRNIYWAKDKSPPIGIDWHISLDNEGKIAIISFSTFGLRFQETELRELIEKFGYPTFREYIDLQNGFGAKFKAIHAQWDDPRGWVEFDGCRCDDSRFISTDSKHGQVTIQGYLSHQKDVEMEKERREHPTPSKW